MPAESSIVSSEIGALPVARAAVTAEQGVAARLCPINPLQDAEWDARLKVHPNHSFFHSAAWARVLETTYGFRLVYLTGNQADAVRCVLPLMEVDSWLTGRRGVALPFTDDCPPLCPDTASGRRLMQGALEFGRSRGWKSVEFRGGRELFDSAPASLSFYGHCLNLEEKEDRLFSRLESSVRRAIRKAEKSGVTTAVSGDLDAMKVFYSLQCKTRKKHGLPPQPFAFFRNIWEHVVSKDLGVVVVASHQRRPVAAAVHFQLGERAVYKFGASDNAFQQLRGANLVMWEAIKWHARHGAKTLHFGRTSIGNEGLRRFKLNWGAQEHKIEYVKYDLRKHAFVTETDEATGWYNRLFNVLPVGLSRLIGAVLYPHWA